MNSVEWRKPRTGGKTDVDIFFSEDPESEGDDSNLFVFNNSGSIFYSSFSTFLIPLLAQIIGSFYLFSIMI